MLSTGNKAELYLDDVLTSTHSNPAVCPGASQTAHLYIFALSYAANIPDKVEVDWARVRKLADPEPTFAIGAEETGTGILAIVNVVPETLNLKSLGNWVTVKIQDFPEDPEYEVSQVIDGTVELENIDAQLTPTNSGNSDGQYMCKVDRLLLEDAIGAPGKDLELKVTGDVADTSFAGTCTIDAIHGI